MLLNTEEILNLTPSDTNEIIIDGDHAMIKLSLSDGHQFTLTLVKLAPRIAEAMFFIKENTYLVTYMGKSHPISSPCTIEHVTGKFYASEKEIHLIAKVLNLGLFNLNYPRP